jgi:hypothetical protein
MGLIVGVTTAVVSNVVVSNAHANKAFVDSYYENLQGGSLALQIKTCKKIYDYSGITDKRIFDLLESKLLTLAGQDKFSREEAEAASWYAKTLASSGDTRYKQSLETVSETVKNRKIRKTALKSIAEINKFKRWNAVINQNEFEMDGRSSTLALWMRMIASDQPDMGIYALEKANTFADYDINFSIMLEEKLLAAIPLKNLNEEKIDFYSKAMEYLMSHPEFGKYTSLVNDVAEQGKNKKLVKAAHRALSR